MFDKLNSIYSIKKHELYHCVWISFIEGCLIASPYYLLVIFFQQLSKNDINYVNISILFTMFLLLLSIRIIVTRHNMIYTTSVAYTSCSQLRLNVAEHLFRVPMSFFSRYSTSDISYRMNKDIAFTENIFAHFFSQFIHCLTVISLLSLLFFCLNWHLALCLLLGIPLAAIAQILLKREANRLSVNLHQEMSKTNSHVMDWVQGIREHRLSGNDQQSLAKLKQHIDHMQKIALKHELKVGLSPILFSILPELGFVLFLLFSLWLYLDSQLLLVDFSVFLIASTRIYLCLGQLGIVMAESRFMEQASARVKSLLDHNILTVGNKNHNISSEVNIENLSFSYPLTVDSIGDNNIQNSVLNNISFSAKPGSLTVIVGSSGAGKTTLIQLLARYYQADGQPIKLGKHSIDQFSDEYLYRHLALVSQDIQLFDTTIMKNLLMAGDNLTEKDVYLACQQTCCDQFIRRLPNGYNSQAGEAGAYLSGGEKQRLALARALLVDAKILLLDEITSALDVKNEQVILKLLHSLKKDKTLIMITHRESLAINANQVVMLRHQRDPIIGQHKQLMEKSEEYKLLWEIGV